MVAQEQNQCLTRITVRAGVYEKAIDVEGGTVLTRGSISDHIKELDMHWSKPLFEEGAIPASLETLYVSDLVKDSYYPSTLKNLIIRDYSGSQPLPVGLRVFVHYNERELVKPACDHYLFMWTRVITKNMLLPSEYSIGDSFTVPIFGSIRATRLTLKPPVQELVKRALPSAKPLSSAKQSFEFSAGNTVASLKVDQGTVIRAGSIPSHIEELNMCMSKPVFEEGAIPASLRYLKIKDHDKDSHYPSSLSLFIHDYSGVDPLPIGPQVYVYAMESDRVRKDQEHYLFLYESKIQAHNLNDPAYDHGLQTKLQVCDRTVWAAKRTPRIAATPDMAAFVRAQTKFMEDQAKLIKTQQELLEAQIQLAVSQKELIDKQIEALYQAWIW